MIGLSRLAFCVLLVLLVKERHTLTTVETKILRYQKWIFMIILFYYINILEHRVCYVCRQAYLHRSVFPTQCVCFA